ncbi:MAG TPA: hypothetical protein P5555_11885 [Candidatus Paceibacterota bacterium]|nr:hypothetical protein [Candidatus Paceibacterota bacterium]
MKSNGSVSTCSTQGAAAITTSAYSIDPATGAHSPGFWFAPAAVGMPALDRKSGPWYFSAYDARRLDRGNIAYGGLSAVGATHSSADFGGGRLPAMAFPYDYAHPYLRLSIQPGGAPAKIGSNFCTNP